MSLAEMQIAPICPFAHPPVSKSAPLLRCAFADTTPLKHSAAVNNQTNEGVAIKKVTNVFSKKILAKRALREIKLLQHFRGHRNVSPSEQPIWLA